MRFRQPLLAITLVGIAFSVPVLAQSSGYPPACEASKVTKADVDRAHTVYLSGKGFLDEANYDKAIGYFKDAYSIDCSVHAILPIIATAYERKGDKASAVQALQEYLKRVPTAPDREVIEHRIKNLQDQMAPAATTSAPSATASAPAPSVAPSATAAPPPSATEAASAPTATPTSQPATEGSGPGVAPWIVVGVGGAALITGGILYGVGAGQVSSSEGVCGGSAHVCPPTTAGSNAQSQGNDGRTLETAGVVAGAVGLAAVAGGLIWHFVGASSASPTTGIAPIVTPGYGGVDVQGTF